MSPDTWISLQFKSKILNIKTEQIHSLHSWSVDFLLRLGDHVPVEVVDSLRDGAGAPAGDHDVTTKLGWWSKV